jgi:hypothetical protein
MSHTSHGATLKQPPVIVGETITTARQGDILVQKIAALPAGLTPAPRDGLGRLILARGERHDHAHAFRNSLVCGFNRAGSDDVDFIEVGGGGATLTHETASGAQADHDPVALAPGVYRVVSQREYVAPRIERRVVD